MLRRIEFQPLENARASAAARASNGPPAAAFSNVLERSLREAREVHFSAHAMQRLRERGLALTAADEAGLERALDRAAEKGARESLVLMEHIALVVSVPNRTVITAVPRSEFGDAVFTHIDSAVLVAPSPGRAGAPTPNLNKSQSIQPGPDPDRGGPYAAD